MRLLLDTSGGEAVCALADSEGVIVERREPTGTEASRQIGELAGHVLGSLLASELKAIVVGAGPGSFIGTRVGISYANGLAVAGSVPLYCVNSLAAMAAVYGGGQSAVVRDARRGEILLYIGSNTGNECTLVQVADLSAILRDKSVRLLVVEEGMQPGRGWSQLRDEISAVAANEGCELHLVPGVPAEGLRRLALPANRVDYAEPVYLRGFL